jgi:thymidylate synthase (FAD)
MAVADSDTSPEQLIRPCVPALEKLLGQPLPVLDSGFVRVIDYLGDDGAVVQAARVSYGRGTKRLREDRGLIRYLMRRRHTTPFEMCEIKFHVRAPMDVWRQWVRHRTANINEYSTRYSLAIDAAQRTQPSEWRRQAPSNRQGSDDCLDQDVGKALSAAEETIQAVVRKEYEERITAGVAREQARKDLPLSTYTEAYWKIDLHNLLHFLSLRMDSHAQQEIRSYATLIGEEIVAKWVPLVWDAFLDYRRESIQLSRIEAKAIHLLASSGSSSAVAFLLAEGLLERKSDGMMLVTREASEFAGKLFALGLTPPWENSE